MRKIGKERLESIEETLESYNYSEKEIINEMNNFTKHIEKFIDFLSYLNKDMDFDIGLTYIINEKIKFFHRQNKFYDDCLAYLQDMKDKEIYKTTIERLENFPNINSQEEKESFEEFKAGMRRLAKE